MAGKLEWFGDEVEKRLRARLSRNMAQATLYLKGQVQVSINRGNADGSNPSLPGEPPKKVTDRLFKSIANRVEESRDSLKGVVGTNVVYARRLELGFVGTDRRGAVIDQAPRPFLRPALRNNETALLRILARD